MSRFKFENSFNLVKLNENGLSDKQREALENVIISNRYHHLIYLNKNLEVRGIIRAFFEGLTIKLPKDIPAFYREFFGQDINELKNKIQKHVTHFKNEMYNDSEKIKNLSLSDILNSCIPLTKFEPNPKHRCKFEDLNNKTFYLEPDDFNISESSDEEIQDALKKRFADKHDE